MKNKIKDLYFEKKDKLRLEIEIFTIQDFIKNFSVNANHGRIIDMPQRIHFYAIALITKGHGTHCIDFVQYNIEAQTICFVANGQVQDIRPEPNSKGYALLFTADFFIKNSLDAKILNDYMIFNIGLQKPNLKLDLINYDIIHDTFVKLYNEYKKDNDFAKPEILRSLLRTLLLQSERIKRNVLQNTEIKQFYYEFTEFKKAVEKEFAKSREVKYYAEQLAVSTKKLNSLVRKVINKSPKQYINN